METITEDYVSFKTAKLLKEKGFNYPCRAVYSPKGIVKHYLKEEVYAHHLKGHKKLCPTLQMAMKWLRKAHYLHISIDMMNGGRWEYEIDDISCPFDGGVLPKCYCYKSFCSYEEAADDAIKYSLEYLI